MMQPHFAFRWPWVVSCMLPVAASVSATAAENWLKAAATISGTASRLAAVLDERDQSCCRRSVPFSVCTTGSANATKTHVDRRSR